MKISHSISIFTNTGGFITSISLKGNSKNRRKQRRIIVKNPKFKDCRFYFEQKFILL